MKKEKIIIISLVVLVVILGSSFFLYAKNFKKNDIAKTDSIKNEAPKEEQITEVSNEKKLENKIEKNNSTENQSMQNSAAPVDPLAVPNDKRYNVAEGEGVSLDNQFIPLIRKLFYIQTKSWADLCSDGKPHVRLLTPNGGVVDAAQITHVTWKSCNDKDIQGIKIQLGNEFVRGTAMPFSLLEASDPMTHRAIIEKNTGSKDILISKYFGENGVVDTAEFPERWSYKIGINAVIDGDENETDFSDTYLTVINGGQKVTHVTVSAGLSDPGQ